MLDALKDLYIYHPFLPVAVAPDWFSHVKDIRCTVKLPATNYISKYKINGNFVRVWLHSIGEHAATLRIRLVQLTTPEGAVREDYDRFETVAIRRVQDYPKTTDRDTLLPWPNNYMLVDDTFSPPTLTTEYELNPDVLVVMQQAPKLYFKDVVQELDLKFVNGYNVSVSANNEGVLFYGASGVGKGEYSLSKLAVLDRNPLGEHQQGVGLRNINGMTGSVQVNGTFPVQVSVISVETGIPLTDTCNRKLVLSRGDT